MIYESSAVSCEDAALLSPEQKEKSEFFVFTQRLRIVPLDISDVAWEQNLSVCRTLLYETAKEKQLVLALPKKMDWPADLIQIQKMKVEKGATSHAFIINFNAPFWTTHKITPKGPPVSLKAKSSMHETIAKMYEPDLKDNAIRAAMKNLSTSTKNEYDKLEQAYGITSPIVKYEILEASQYRTAPIAVETAAKKWVAEKERVQAALVKHNLTGRLDKNDPNNTLLFASVVMQTLKFDDETQTLQCPYGQAAYATNFIAMLVTTGVCQCQCFSMYMIAMAQEFGFTMLTPLRLEGHVVPVVITENVPAVECSVTASDYWRELGPLSIKPNVRSCFADIEAGARYLNHYFEINFATKAAETQFLNKYNEILRKFNVGVHYTSKEEEEEKKEVSDSFFASAHWQWDFMPDKMDRIIRRKEKQNLVRFLKEVANLATCVSLDPLMLLNTCFKIHIPKFPPLTEQANNTRLYVTAMRQIRKDLIGFGDINDRGLPTCFVLDLIFALAVSPTTNSSNSDLRRSAQDMFGYKKVVWLEEKLKQTEAAVNNSGVVSRTIRVVAALVYVHESGEETNFFLKSWHKFIYGTVPRWGLFENYGNIFLSCLDAFAKDQEKFGFLRYLIPNDGFTVLSLMSVAEELNFTDRVAPVPEKPAELVLFEPDGRTVAQWFYMDTRTVKDYRATARIFLPHRLESQERISDNGEEKKEVVRAAEGPWTYLNILLRKMLTTTHVDSDQKIVMLMFFAKSLLFPTWLFVLGEAAVRNYFNKMSNVHAEAPYNTQPTPTQINMLVDILTTQ